MNERRCRQLIERATGTFELNLAGRVVLTEAATGYYVLTPLIAALAGAEHVYALTRDSRYGRAAEVRDETLRLAQRWGVADRVRILSGREDERLGEADIVTNLGFVRPLDAPFLSRLKKTVVIPLMWETWEYRPTDLDLLECRRLGIPVLGTNEHHHDLQIFGYVGQVALKLLFEAEVEIYRTRVLVVGGGEFAEQVAGALRAVGADVARAEVSGENSLRSAQIRRALEQADALVVVEHHSRETLIGEGGALEPRELAELNPALVVTHICGGVDRTALDALGIRCWPAHFAPPGYMSVATDYIGPRPLVDLHTAGLKVGARMSAARGRGLSGLEAELSVLDETPLAQGFAGCHDGVRTKQ